MEAITKDIRKVMKLLKEGHTIVLNSVFMNHVDDNKFIINYLYNGIEKKYFQKRSWIKNFIKNDYLNQDLYLIRKAS